MNYRNFILRCCQFYELFISQILEIIHIALQCYDCNRGLTSDKVDQSDYMQEKITIHISLTKAVILQAINPQFLRYYCHANLQQHTTASQKYSYRLCFLPPSHSLTDLSGNTCFLQQVQKVTSLGCNCVIFIQCCLFYFVVIILTTKTFSKYVFLFSFIRLVNIVDNRDGVSLICII